jgi:hypothetical protein
MRATKSLEISVRLGVPASSGLTLLSLSCQRMPWLVTQEDVRDLIRRITNAEGHISVEDLARELESSLRDMLTQDLIDVDPQVTLTLEEHAEGSCGRFGKIVGEGVSVVTYDEYIHYKSTTCTPSDVVELSKSYSLVFHPDDRSRTSAVPVTLNTAVWVAGIQIACDGVAIASVDVQQAYPAGLHLMPIPVPSVRSYGQIARSSELCLRVFVGDNPQPVETPIEVALPAFCDEPATLFIDMGSTRFKMIAMEVGRWNAYSASEVSSWIATLNQHELTEETEGRIEVFSPRPTSDVLHFYEIPLTEKQSLAALSDAELAAWLGRAAMRFSLHWANKKQSRALGEIVWSFPQTEENPRDCQAIAERATHAASQYILGTLHVVEEHMALHARFASTFEALSRLARDAVARRHKLEARNIRLAKEKSTVKREYRKNKKAYDDSWFKFLHTEPEQPDWSRYASEEVPSLQEFHERFLRLSPTDTFADWVVLDAGGFTLDVFAMISGQRLGRSFVAGGDQLTGDVRRELARIKDVDEFAVTMADAEKAKRDACLSRSASGTRPLARFCEQRTNALYTPAVRSVVSWVKQVTSERLSGLPLVLTGGGMYNEFLRALIQSEFEASGFTTVVPLTSTEVCQILEKEFPERVVESGLGMFYGATHGFSRSLRADMSRDVANGLVQWLINQPL